MDPPSFGMESKVGAAMVGSALMCKKKIRFNLLKISSKFASHEMMRCPIYSPTNIAYMSRWMAKIQFKPNKEEEKNCKRKSSQGRDVQAWDSSRLHSSKYGPLLCHVWDEIKFRFEEMFKVGHAKRFF